MPRRKSIINLADIERFLSEDIGSGDITTDSIIPVGQKGTGVFLAKEDFVLACIHDAVAILSHLDPEIKYKTEEDGSFIRKGDEFCKVTGSTRALLTGERAALNLLQRMCAIATLSREFADAAAGKAKVVDTRKTTPGLRLLEKYAVRTGGCHNHRLGLDDGILIKDNHIKAAGGIPKAVDAVKKRGHHLLKIEVEVTSLDELQEALDTGADGVLLDNMDNEMITRAVEIVKGRLLTEVSGGVTLERIPGLCATGVDYISVGALTHSAGSVDISFEIE